MAHLIKIPILFDFRISKVKWTLGVGRVVGTSPGTEFLGIPKLKVEVPVASTTIFADVDCDDISPELEDPLERYTTFVENDDLDKGARQAYGDCRVQLFIALEEKNPLKLSLGELLNPEQYFRARTQAGDAWCLREAFLKLTPDTSKILEFLTRWGLWTSRNCVQPHKILSFQKRIRRALLSPPHEWLSKSESTLSPSDTRPRYPNFAINTYYCETAISATVTIDLLRKAKFKICSRPDCRQTFEITSRHKRNYCCQYCAHLQSMRRMRSRSST